MEFELGDPNAEASGTLAMIDVDMESRTTEVASDHRRFKNAQVLEAQQYLQAEQISGNDVNDWSGLPELPKRTLGEVQSVANIFRSSFTILQQAWSCSPAECIPESLRLTTPYSLGLVVRLAELALLARDRKDDAHTTLLNLARERSAQMPSQLQTTVFTGLARGMPHKRYVEHRVQENVYGLMIEDVEMAKLLCTSAPGHQQLSAPVEDRTSRAAKRLNRAQSWPSDLKTGLQHETQVGDGARGHEWLKEQPKLQRQEKSGKARVKKERMRRKEILDGLQRNGGKAWNKLPATEDQQMQDVLGGDQVMDSASALPSSQHEGQSKDQTSKRTPKKRNAKNRARALDRYLARSFKGMSVKQDESSGDLIPEDEEL